MTTLVFLVVVLAVVIRTMTPEARIRALRSVAPALNRLRNYGQKELEPFRAALRVRTAWAVVTPAIACLQVLLFASVLFGQRAESDTATLVGWGASFGPRTTNGEWWRLATAMFLHARVLALIINTVAVVQVGLVLERLLGPFAFATAYLATGLAAGVATLWMYPTAVTAGASGAVYGTYGLLLVSAIAGRLYPSDLTIPAIALKRLAPMAAVFLLYNVTDTNVSTAAQFVGLAAGAVLGVVFASDIDRAPQPRRVATAAATSLVALGVCAVVLRGITDVRPELQRIVATEQRTEAAYEAAAQRVSKGKMNATALAQLIDRAIVPELEAADARMAALDHVPSEDKHRIADVQLYLRLRCQSWKFRAESLRAGATPATVNAGQLSDSAMRTRTEAHYRSTMLARGKAEAAERAALETLDRITRESALAQPARAACCPE